MKLHEFQARELLRQFDVDTGRAAVVTDAEDAARAAAAIGGAVMVKAQVLTGGRGKAGGVRRALTPEEARNATQAILRLSIKNLPVKRVLVVEALPVVREFYVGLTVDRQHRLVECILSAEGGVDIERTAESSPEKIVRVPYFDKSINNKTPFAADVKTVFGENAEKASELIAKLYRLFNEKDCSLLEINPCVLTADGRLVAADAKIILDDNALFKHPDLEQYRNAEEYGAAEIDARRSGLSFVSLDGTVGCMVNGAGLAMATMDLIRHFGGSPANFLDVGGSSNPEKVLAALKILLSNPSVTAILINIFGGITRCDDIARGIVMAKQRLAIRQPMVIRLTGTNGAQGREILGKEGTTAVLGMTEAVRRVVAMTGGAL